METMVWQGSRTINGTEKGTLPLAPQKHFLRAFGKGVKTKQWGGDEMGLQHLHFAGKSEPPPKPHTLYRNQFQMDRGLKFKTLKH